MKEEMKRLLLDGKIVGYEWHRILDGAKLVTIWYRREGEVAWTHTSEQDIDYDAFEQGIKVRDEWWFEGDEVYRETCAEDDIACGCYGATGTLICKDGCISIDWDNEDDNLDFGCICSVFRAGIKRIGNIHERQEDENI